MADHQDAQGEAHPKQDEAVFVLRVVRIELDHGFLVVEGALRLLEGHAVLALIRQVLALIPNELKMVHVYNVRIRGLLVNRPNDRLTPRGTRNRGTPCEWHCRFQVLFGAAVTFF